MDASPSNPATTPPAGPAPDEADSGGAGRVHWWDLRWDEWRDVLKETFHEVKVDNVPIVSAGVAFYAVLAVIPVAIMAVTLYGLVTDPAEAERQIQELIDVLPEDAASLIANQVRPIASTGSGVLTLGFAVSALGLLWTASNATRATVRAVVIAYDQEEEQSRLGTRLAAIGLTIAVLAFFAVVLGLVAVVPAWLAIASLNVPASALRWVVLLGVVFGGALLVYRYAPPRDAPAWGSLVPGALFAALAWVAVSAGFAFYVNNFGAYNQTYGVLGGAVILMMWFFLSALAILIGGEANAVLERHCGVTRPGVTSVRG